MWVAIRWLGELYGGSGPSGVVGLGLYLGRVPLTLVLVDLGLVRPGCPVFFRVVVVGVWFSKRFLILLWYCTPCGGITPPVLDR